MNYAAATCPNCLTGMAPIVYGYPTTDMVDYAIQELITLGGPNRQEYTHYCYSCNETYVVED